MTATAWFHIQLDEQGRPWVGNSAKVVEIVLDKLAYGWSPEEICRQHSGLTLAQVHAALGYYHEHQIEIDAEIERQLGEIDAISAAAVEQPTIKKLKAAAAAKRAAV